MKTPMKHPNVCNCQDCRRAARTGPTCGQCQGTGRVKVTYGKKYGQYEICEGCNGSGKAW